MQSLVDDFFSDDAIMNMRLRRTNSRRFLIRALRRRMLQDVDDVLPCSIPHWKSRFNNNYVTNDSRHFSNPVSFHRIEPHSPYDDLPHNISEEGHNTAVSKPPFSHPAAKVEATKFESGVTCCLPNHDNLNRFANDNFASSSHRSDGDGSECPDKPIPIPVIHASDGKRSTAHPDFVPPSLLLLRSEALKERNRRQIPRIKIAPKKLPVHVVREVRVRSFPTLVISKEEEKNVTAMKDAEGKMKMESRVQQRMETVPLQREGKTSALDQRNVEIETLEQTKGEKKALQQDNVKTTAFVRARDKDGARLRISRLLTQLSRVESRQAATSHHVTNGNDHQRTTPDSVGSHEPQQVPIKVLKTANVNHSAIDSSLLSDHAHTEKRIELKTRNSPVTHSEAVTRDAPDARIAEVASTRGKSGDSIPNREANTQQCFDAMDVEVIPQCSDSRFGGSYNNFYSLTTNQPIDAISDFCQVSSSSTESGKLKGQVVNKKSSEGSAGPILGRLTVEIEEPLPVSCFKF